MTDEEKKVLEEGPEPVSAWPGGCPHGLDTCPDAGEKSPLGRVSCRRPAGEPCSVDEMAEARIAQMEQEIADEIAPGLLRRIDSSYELACGLYDVHKIAARHLDAWVNGVRNDKQHVRDMGDCLAELFDRVSRLAGEIRESRYALENAIGAWGPRDSKPEDAGWPTRASLLRHYASRPVTRFVQLDGFLGEPYADGNPIGRNDADGDMLYGGITHELMYGSNVRLLVKPGTSVRDAVRILGKFSEWILKEQPDPSRPIRLHGLGMDDGQVAEEGDDDV